MKKAFTILELSITLIIIALLLSGVIKSSNLVSSYKIQNARQLTSNSAVTRIAGLALWLEPTSEKSFSRSVNGGHFIEDQNKIATWYDLNLQTTSRKNFTQLYSSFRPKFIEDGIGGLPSVLFNKNSHTHLFNPHAVLDISDNDYTIISVSKLINENNNHNYIFTQGGAHFENSCQVGTIAGFSYYKGYGFDSCGSNFHMSNQDALNKDFINAAIINGDEVKFFSNSTIEISAKLPLKNIGPAFAESVVGGSSHSVYNVNEIKAFDGQISEIIIYDRPLRQDEILDVLKYLSKKYSITLSNESPAPSL